MRDILLQIDSYPAPTPSKAIDQAVQFSKSIDGRISGLAVRIDIRVPQDWLAERLVGATKLADEEEAKSCAFRRAPLERFKASAVAVGIFAEILIAKASIVGVAPRVVSH